MSEQENNNHFEQKVFARASSIPDYLQFPPINDRLCEGSRSVMTWVNGYLNFRDTANDDAAKCKAYLDAIGQNSSIIASRFRGSMLGLALGDALGATLEFSVRDFLPPVTDIVGGGPFKLKAGEWTDDTSMALCLAHSLIRREGFVAQDIMDMFYLWWKRGVFSVNGKCFDIGNTVVQALEKFQTTDNPVAGSIDPFTAGNGSLMRLAPVVLFNFLNIEQCISACAESSKLTHGATEAVDACKYFGVLIRAAIKGVPKKLLTAGLYEPAPNFWNSRPLSPGVIAAVENIAGKSRDQIKSTGYVIDTLEAALWAFHNSDNFVDGAILAVNLAGDSDTVGAVYGQLAGAYYGEMGIGTKWIRKLSRYPIFYHYADQLLRFGVCDFRPTDF